MNPASEDIVEMITGESVLGLVMGTDLFVGRMPKDEAGFQDCVVINDLPGDGPSLTFDKTTSNFYSSAVVVRCRNTDYRTGYSVLKSIIEFLHMHGGVTINGTVYDVIQALGDAQFLEWDVNNRAIWMVNFSMKRK